MAAGPLTAATASRSPQAASRSRTRAAGSATDSIPPRPASAASAWLRSATTRAASSRDKIPATQAAAISPWLWPTTASGVIPAACQSAASDTITAHSAGWTTSARSRPGAPSAPASTSSSDQSTYGRQRPPALGQPGREHRRGCRQLPAHPGPLRPLTGEHEHHPARAARRRGPGDHPGRRLTCRHRGQPGGQLRPGRAPMTTARCPNTDLVVASDHPISAGSRSGRAATNSAQPPRLRRQPLRRPAPTPATASRPASARAAALGGGGPGVLSASGSAPRGPARG